MALGKLGIGEDWWSSGPAGPAAEPAPMARTGPGAFVLSPDLSDKEFIEAQKEMTRTSAPRTSAAPASSGVSAGEVMQGIGAVLAPLVQAGVGIYSAHQQMEMQKEMMKSQQRPYPGQQMPIYLPPPPKKSPVMIILLGIVVLAVVGVMMYMMTRGKDAGYAPPTSYTPLVAPPYAAAPAAPAPQMRRVRRVKKRKRRPPSKKK